MGGGLLALAVWRGSLGWWIPALVALAPIAWDQIRRVGEGLYRWCARGPRMWARIDRDG